MSEGEVEKSLEEQLIMRFMDIISEYMEATGVSMLEGALKLLKCAEDDIVKIQGTKPPTPDQEVVRNIISHLVDYAREKERIARGD